MKTSSFSNSSNASGGGFDLFRLTRSKQTVDLSPNAIRSLHRAGLPVYRSGRAVFISKSELDAFIRARSNHPTPCSGKPPADCESQPSKRKTGTEKSESSLGNSGAVPASK